MFTREQLWKLEDDTYYDAYFEGITVSGVHNKRYSGREIKVYCKNPNMVSFDIYNKAIFRLTDLSVSEDQTDPDEFGGPTVW